MGAEEAEGVAERVVRVAEVGDHGGDESEEEDHVAEHHQPIHSVLCEEVPIAGPPSGRASSPVVELALVWLDAELQTRG